MYENQSKLNQHPSKNNSQINAPMWIDFRSNLARFWGRGKPQSSWLGAGETRILFSITFWIDFWLICYRFSTPKSIKIRSKTINQSSQRHNNQKTKILTNRWFLQYSRALGYVMLCTKINKNWTNIHQKTTLKSMLQFWSILEPTWLYIGRVLGSRWGQDGAKMAPNRFKNLSQNQSKKW